MPSYNVCTLRDTLRVILKMMSPCVGLPGGKCQTGWDSASSTGQKTHPFGLNFLEHVLIMLSEAVGAGDRVKKIVFSWKIKFRCFLPLLDSVDRPAYWLQAWSPWEGTGHSGPRSSSLRKALMVAGTARAWHGEGGACRSVPSDRP